MKNDRAIRYALEVASLFRHEADEVRHWDHDRYEACRQSAIVLEEFARTLAEAAQQERALFRVIH